MKVNESFPFSISLSWKAPSSDAQESGPNNTQRTLVFPKGNPIPSVKALTIYRSGTFSIDVQYDDVSGLQTPAKISTYTVRQFLSFYLHTQHILLAVIWLSSLLKCMQIGPFQSTKNEKAKVKVKVRLNVHGIISVESATVSLSKLVDCFYYFSAILLRSLWK